MFSNPLPSNLRWQPVIGLACGQVVRLRLEPDYRAAVATAERVATDLVDVEFCGACRLNASQVQP